MASKWLLATKAPSLFYIYSTGISLFETSTCRLQIGRLLHDSERFPDPDFEQLCRAEAENLAVRFLLGVRNSFCR